jgi:hypothetical protein
VRRLDDLIAGLRALETAPPPPPNSQNKNTGNAVTRGASAAADRDACFCQGKQTFSLISLLHLGTHKRSIILITIVILILIIIIIIIIAQMYPYYYSMTHPNSRSPHTRPIRIHPNLHILRSHPLHAEPAPLPLPTLRHTTPHAARTPRAHCAA